MDDQQELRESRGLTISKEVPLPWLIAFIFGGLANLIAVTWLLSTQANQLETNTKDISSLKDVSKDATDVLKLHSEELVRRIETDKNLTDNMAEAKVRLQHLEERLPRR